MIRNIVFTSYMIFVLYVNKTYCIISQNIASLTKCSNLYLYFLNLYKEPNVFIHFLMD